MFETHSTTEDNEAGRGTGWLPGLLSETGRAQAAELGARRRDDDLAAVFCSDLDRAVQTLSIAFGGTPTPRLLDWRLRECDYGRLNGTREVGAHASRLPYLDQPYPGGESWRGAVARIGRFLDDLPTRWDGTRVLVVGHVATRWGFDHHLNGAPLERLAREDFDWQPGWEYDIS